MSVFRGPFMYSQRTQEGFGNELYDRGREKCKDQVNWSKAVPTVSQRDMAIENLVSP